MGSRAPMVLRIPLSFFLLLLASASAQLSVDYYSKTCPNAEEIVRKEMIQILSVAPSLTGPFLRLHFHDCFVRVWYQNGCYWSYLYQLYHYIILKGIDAQQNWYRVLFVCFRHFSLQILNHKPSCFFFLLFKCYIMRIQLIMPYISATGLWWLCFAGFHTGK
jgi:hypothetical protein